MSLASPVVLLYLAGGAAAMWLTLSGIGHALKDYLCTRWTTTSSVASTKFKVYLVETTHSRVYPVFHSFKYPLFYFGIPVPVPSESFGLGHNTFKIFSVQDSDHLTSPSIREGNMYAKVILTLQRFGIGPDDVGRIELVTTPRVFGYSFNPLSVFYVFCKSDNSQLLAAILEVNNTFSEKHVYICDPKTNAIETLKGFDSSFLMSRSFHVSPFNNRSGNYEAHLKINPCRLDILLNIKKYVDTTASPDHSECTTDQFGRDKVHFSARVFGDAYELNMGMMIYLVLVYPINALLTSPRIMYQAFLLAYRKNLPVYQRPNAYTLHPFKNSQTISPKPPSSYQMTCMDIVLKQLKADSTFYATISVTDSPSPLVIGTPSTMRPLTFQINSYNFFVRLVCHWRGPSFGLFEAFCKGDVYCSPSALIELYRVINPQNVIVSHSSLLSFSNWIDRTKFDWSTRYILFKGLLLDQIEMRYFEATATFVKNGEPWLLTNRCEKIYQEWLQEEQKHDQWDIPDLEMVDNTSSWDREQKRGHMFLSALKHLTTCGDWDNRPFQLQ